VKRIGAVIFHPPAGPSPTETLVASARLHAAADLITAVRPLVSTVIVVGDRSAAGSLDVAGVHLVPIRPETSFHFGDTLQSVVRDQRLDAVLYFGSGSGALLEDDDLSRMAAFAEREDPAALFNNFYSCDFATFSDTSFLMHGPLPASDNGIGFLLADAGVRCYALPRSVKTQFDLDTPIDVLLLQASDRGGPRLRAFLESQKTDHPTLAGVTDVLVRRESLVYLIGRVSPVTWQAFETQVACRTAGIVEGRGMKAYARHHRPILPTLLDQDGGTRFFAALQDSANAAIIDSRPLLAPDGNLPSPDQRFASDLYRLSDLHDRRWLSFTEQAAACSIPILLGGHSLVSGGLYLLSEICWKGRNLPRRLHPDPYEGDGQTA